MKLNRLALFVALLASSFASMLHAQAIGSLTCDSFRPISASYYDVAVGPTKSVVTIHVALGQFNNLLPLVGAPINNCALETEQVRYNLTGLTLTKLDASSGGSNAAGAQAVQFAQALFQVSAVNVSASDLKDDGGISGNWNRTLSSDLNATSLGSTSGSGSWSQINNSETPSGAGTGSPSTN
jgi:hypothetical protein